jgi:predicted PurR-regulated permease PerM
MYQQNKRYQLQITNIVITTQLKGTAVEYIFIFTYSVILALMTGVTLGAVVSFFSKKNKLKRFQSTLFYSTIIVAASILVMAFING